MKQLSVGTPDLHGDAALGFPGLACDRDRLGQIAEADAIDRFLVVAMHGDPKRHVGFPLLAA